MITIFLAGRAIHTYPLQPVYRHSSALNSWLEANITLSIPYNTFFFRFFIESNLPHLTLEMFLFLYSIFFAINPL